MLIKGIIALVDAKRANSFNNTIKMLNANVEITHNRLVTLENRTSMMAKAIMPALKDLKLQINKTNERLASQYRVMSSAHNRYNLLFRQTHETQTIHHFTLLLFKNYLTIQVGSLQRVLFSRVTSLLCVISTLAFNIFMALLKEFALFASTKAFIPLINIPPIAAVPCAIASNGIAAQVPHA